MEPDLAAWLCSGAGQAAIAQAHAQRKPSSNELQESTALRATGLLPEQVAAILTQLDLAHRAESLHLPLTWLLTRDGLEQGTNPAVAKRRGDLLDSAGVRSVIDATAGLGFDSAGFIAAGLEVTSIERDAATAALLAHNVPAAQVIKADAVELLPMLLGNAESADSIFVDPARRVPGQRTADGLRAQSERDPNRWAPPLPWIIDLAEKTKVVVKVAPGFRDVPQGWRAEWISVGRVVVEATLWSFDAIPSRQAVVIDENGAHTIARSTPTPDATAQASVQGIETAHDHHEPQAFLLEPDPAVVAAGVRAEVAHQLSAHHIDGSHWLTSATQQGSPFVRSFRVEEELPSAAKELRAALRARGITNPTIKSAGTGIDAERMRRELKAGPGQEAVIALLRVDERIRAFRISTV